jgi:deazaflavin-dependent oxidoreductase (nitroreductase family)
MHETSAHPVGSLAQVTLSALRERFYRGFARWHTRVLVQTDGRPAHLTPRLRCLVLETAGRSSGRAHQVVLLYMPDGDAFVVLASNFGRDQAPAWWLNLEARPETVVRVAGRRVPVRARELAGAEREEMVSRAMSHNKQWRAYITTMYRRVPVIRLEPDGG